MPAASPHRPAHSSAPREPRRNIYALEATGLIVIAVLILIFTVARYWHHIPWSAR